MQRSQRSERRPNRSKSRAHSAKRAHLSSFAQRAVVREHSAQRSESRNLFQANHASSAKSAHSGNLADGLAKVWNGLTNNIVNTGKNLQKSADSNIGIFRSKLQKEADYVRKH